MTETKTTPQPEYDALYAFDAENNIEPASVIAERIAAKYGFNETHSLVDDIHYAIEDAMELGQRRGRLIPPRIPDAAQAVTNCGELDPPAKWLDEALRNLARELLADPKTPWIGDRDPKQHICWTAADRLLASSLSSTHREADVAQVDAAREFVKRHPALTLIDLAEFEAFLKVPAMVDAALSSTNLGSHATGTPSREPTGEYTITPANRGGAST